MSLNGNFHQTNAREDQKKYLSCSKRINEDQFLLFENITKWSKENLDFSYDSNVDPCLNIGDDNWQPLGIILT